MKQREIRLEVGKTDATEKTRQEAKCERMDPVWDPFLPFPPSKAGGGISVQGGRVSESQFSLALSRISEQNYFGHD